METQNDSSLLTPDAGNKETDEQQKLLVVKEDEDNALAERAYNELSSIFKKHYENAIMEAGGYILKEFYGGDFEMARANKSNRKGSVRQLIDMLKQQSSKGPSKTWFYNAIGLVIQEHDLSPKDDASEEDKRCFQTYGNISLSHKVRLLRVSDLEQKKQLITKISDDSLSVRQLDAEIKKLDSLAGNGSDGPGLNEAIHRPHKLFAKKNHEQDILDMIAKMDESSLGELIDNVTKYKEKVSEEIDDLKKKAEFKKDYVRKFDWMIQHIDSQIKRMVKVEDYEPEPSS